AIIVETGPAAVVLAIQLQREGRLRLAGDRAPVLGQIRLQRTVGRIRLEQAALLVHAVDPVLEDQAGIAGLRIREHRVDHVRGPAGLDRQREIPPRSEIVQYLRRYADVRILVAGGEALLGL